MSLVKSNLITADYPTDTPQQNFWPSSDIVPVSAAQQAVLAAQIYTGVDNLLNPAANKYGASKTGAVNSNSAFKAAIIDLKSFVTSNIGGDYDPITTGAIKIPPGQYLITEEQALLGQEILTGKANGLTIYAEVPHTVQIVFNPSASVTAWTTGTSYALNDVRKINGFIYICTTAHTSGTFATDLAANKWARKLSYLTKIIGWVGCVFENITFLAMDPDSVVTSMDGLRNEQGTRFHECIFSASTSIPGYGWKYYLYLPGVSAGTNNCSENIFSGGGSYGMQNDGACIGVPSTANSSADQYLNHIFTNMFKHWSTTAALVDMARGGHIAITDVDVSDWGAAATATSLTGGASPGDGLPLASTGAYIIKLRGPDHNAGVCTVVIRKLRGELKNAEARLIYSEWGYGDVTVENFDMTSQTPGFTYGKCVAYLMFPNAPGAKYTFKGGSWAGGIAIEYGLNAFAYPQVVTVEDISWSQKRTPNSVVTFIASGGHSNLNSPVVEFSRCRSLETVYGLSAANPYVVWDSSIGAVGILGQLYGAAAYQLKKRSVNVAQVYGGLSDGVMGYIQVPLGAYITDIKIVLPAASTANAAAWVTATAYAVGNSVTQGGSQYICLTAHTSGVFATDLAAVKWRLMYIEVYSDPAGANTLIGNIVFTTLPASGLLVSKALAIGPTDGSSAGTAIAYSCSTSAKTILGVKTGAFAGNNALILIEGYW